jgi:predicted permease
MTDELEQVEPLEHRKRKRYGVWCAILGLVFVVYALSPPIVAWLLGLQSGGGIYVWGSSGFNVFYSPLITLSNRFDSAYEFYVWYFEFFPLHDESSGFGRVIHPEP